MAEGFSPLALAGFELFFQRLMKSRVRLVVGPLPAPPADRPVVFVANHTSWWDPFVIREIHRSLRPEAPLYTLMLESELAQRPFFRRIGVVGIDPTSPGSVRQAMRTLQQRLRDHPNACVTWFPQGQIWPAGRRPLGFRRGIDRFLRGLDAATVIPIALREESLNHLRPTLFALAGTPIQTRAEAVSSDALEREIERLLDEVDRHLNRHGEQAESAWPPPRSE